MTRISLSAVMTGLLLAGSFGAALAVHHAVTAQERAKTQPAAQYIGPTSCTLCHGAGAQAALYTRDFVLLTESPTWLREDKHAQAFELLRGELGRNILARLGVEAPAAALEDEAPPQVVRQCLACHANWRMDRETPPGFHNFKQFGVSCESCHGPASEWRTPHENPDWRKIPAAKKSADHGMVDVRDPIQRARQCFSCHVGDVKQGKFVTHAMYAAGHPPLPGFEIETFARAMPPHWRELPEKGDFRFKAEFLQANYPQLEHDPTGDLPQTRAVVLGGVMALRESVQLLADHAAGTKAGGAGQPDVDVAAFPDFAAYDCASCHHDLRPQSWRVERGYGGLAPGRPPMPQWPTALTNLAIRQYVGPDGAAYVDYVQRLETQVDELRKAVARQPFGDRKAIQAAAAPLIALLDRIAERVARSRYDRPAAERALAELLGLPEDAYPDYHSARQIAWAVKIIAAELEAPYPDDFAAAPAQETGEQARGRGERDVRHWEQWKANVKQPAVQAIDALLAEVGLDEQLQLDLPAGQAGDIQAFQHLYLRAIAAYDPQAFRARLAEVAAKLKQPAAP